MPTIEISKTGYTKFVDADADAFTAQCLALSGWEIQFGETEPAVTVAGVLVPAGLEHGVTRVNGTGHGWAKLPAGSTQDAADVVVIGA